MTILVLVLLGLITAMLILYARVRMPRLMAERFNDSLQAFGIAVELRFPSHQGLTARVVPLSMAVGRRLGLRPQDLRNLELAARLRDIGLCAIPYRLVNGQKWNEWSDADRATYQRHQEVSAAMLEAVPSLRHLAPIVRCHHSNFDGSDGGFFPCGDAIPIEARILKAVVEYVWYERLQGALIASDRLATLEGTAFDPQVVAALRDVLTCSRVGDPARPEPLAPL
ncbi:MAG TPA: HD domain-containing phosphohydrolase [Fimbriimonadaceae bacterium]|nr:HD domain-containing phosphohydrolase [Fimbriimonadaceae bacterium]